jgi:hypothetical protein
MEFHTRTRVFASVCVVGAQAFLRLFPDAFGLEDHPPGPDGLGSKGFDIILK